MKKKNQQNKDQENDENLDCDEEEGEQKKKCHYLASSFVGYIIQKVKG